ncbi:restriction endonuclease subunit S [Sutcliffiella cohnii]|uniref:restriction endonuclease subunit S n=1 Tax=Sutcliffiella cohnii TaxID=33932 RepID=UPI002E247F97|nr:restriction endonuclease subunit S [Sutcliffiella cohnii]MED4015526.1 restriction endonuclease subunit S [Sutcliffiella cohnii]
MISNNWKEITLEDVVDVLGDGLHGTPKYDVHGEYYFINGNNLNGKIIVNDQTKKVGKDQYLKYKKDLNDRTILISINGTLGKIAVYNGEKVVLGKSACYFNVKENYNKEFIKYVMYSKKFKDYLNTHSTGTTIKNMGLKQMRAFKFHIPSLAEQNSIANILSTLDEKIELNNQINEKLEELAQYIFKRWFVEFEFPNEDGNPYKSSGGKFIESEIGLIPENWSISNLGEVISVQNGFAFKSKDFKEVGEIGVIKIKNISEGVVDVNNTQYIDLEVSIKTNEKFLIHGSDILIAMTGAEVGKIGIVPQTSKKLYLNQRVGKIIGKINGGKEFVFYYLSRNSVQEQIKSIAMGSAQPNISSTSIENIKSVVPTKSVLEKYGKLTSSIISNYASNLEQNNNLSSLRNNILPKLMNGEIPILEIEKEVEECLQKSN